MRQIWIWVFDLISEASEDIFVKFGKHMRVTAAKICKRSVKFKTMAIWTKFGWQVDAE